MLLHEQVYYENPLLWTRDRALTGVEIERLDRIVDMVPTTAHSLLDVGCGSGAFLHRLRQQRAIECSGIDRSVAACDAARREFGLDVRQGDAASISAEDESFDVVCALEMLEHLPASTYERARQELGRVARRYILINVPYNERRYFNTCPECGSRFPRFQHLRRFTCKTLEGLFPGFGIVRSERIAQEYCPVWALPYRRIQDFRGHFAEFAICPLCGFEASRSASDAQAVSASARILAAVKRWPLLRWPLVRCYEEIVVLYERANRAR